MQDKHAVYSNKISKVLFQLKSLIESYSKYTSHYSTHDNNEKSYLFADLSIYKIYEMYIEK